jgi:hypothetical protein
LSYFHPGVNFNSEIADMRDPPVSGCFLCQARLSVRSLRMAAMRYARAACPNCAEPLAADRASRPRRRPDSQPPPCLTRCQPPLSEDAPPCPLLSRACSSTVHASLSTPPTPLSTPSERHHRRLRPVSRGAVAFAAPPCHPCAVVYTTSSAAPPSTHW